MSHCLDDLKGKRALIVDDEELIREIFAKELQDINVHVDEAANGDIAFDKIMNTDYDFIISDVRMSHGSGYDLLKKLKEVDKKVFIVMATGFSDLSLLEAKKLGAQTIFEKPFEIEEILTYIAENL